MSSIFTNIFNKGQDKESKIELATLKEKPIPVHVAIIMDGNGRWARMRGLPRAAGHKAGMETLRRIVESSIEIGLQYLTVYAFSTENWKRPKEEVDALMGLLVEYIKKELQQLKENGVRVQALGKIEDLPLEARIALEKAIDETIHNNRLSLQIALNYGGRREIIDAVKGLCKDVIEEGITYEDIDERLFSQYLYNSGIPDPDLIIRASGEMRISNFLLWQSAYAEFWATDVLWPDFNKTHLYKAIYEYQRRKRRYGGI